MGKRRRHSGAFKAKVALEAIRGESGRRTLAGPFQVHPAQIAAWKKQALEGLPELFGNGHARKQQGEDELKAQLYQPLGQLKVELDFLKKKSGLVD